jgi:predicted nucleic acid-binding protein
MTGMLLDTTILIDLLRGNTNAADFVDTAFADRVPLFVSVISAMELVVGCRNKREVDQAKHLITSFGLLHLHPSESRQAYELVQAYSKSHGLAIPGALIAATALAQELELASDNVRHFEMISGLRVARPYQQDSPI